MDQDNHSKEINMSFSHEPLMESNHPPPRPPPPPPSPPNNEEDEEEALLDDDNLLINDDFSEEEEEVAAILLQLPELISNCPRVSLKENLSWFFKKERSAINVLSAPPSSPDDDDPMNEVSV